MEEKLDILVTLFFGIFILLMSLSFSNPEKKSSKGLEYQIINKSRGCLSTEKVGTSYNYSNNTQVVETILETPHPCYELKKFNLTQEDNETVVHIQLRSKKGFCVQCLGYYKIRYEINTSKELEIKTVKNISDSKITFENTTSTENENESFCGTSTYGKCFSDSECQVMGSHNQICQSSHGSPHLTKTLEYQECYNSTKFGLECQCVSKSCRWV